MIFQCLVLALYVLLTLLVVFTNNTTVDLPLLKNTEFLGLFLWVVFCNFDVFILGYDEEGTIKAPNGP